MRTLMFSTLVLAIMHAMSSVVVGSAQTPGDAIALGSDAVATGVRVGHSVKRLVVQESPDKEPRNVDVHLWYPADPTGFAEAPKTFYTSTLYGEPLIAALWDPLSWKIEARIAREQAAIDPAGRAFPVIVFSHGAMNEPIDYAYTLERIAAAGFVVAAPVHVNNSQDDVRRDHVNSAAKALGLPPVLACRDGLPSPCARMDVARSMADRARDVSSVLTELPNWYGDRVNLSRAGIMGHSRGTVTALTAAGGGLRSAGTSGCGTAPWSIDADPRIKAVLGLAIGAALITSCVNFANVSVPTVLIAGTLDANSTPAVSKMAYERLTMDERLKQLVSFHGAVHRSFDSTYCAQMQAAGAVARGEPPAIVNPRAILDKHTVDRIVVAPAFETEARSGVATDYCSLAAFTEPVDIRTLASSIRGFDFGARKVPATGVDTEMVMRWVTDGTPDFEGAVAFFNRVLKHDSTPPVIAYSILGTLGTAGWYVSDVGVNWTISDPDSDIETQTGCNSTSITADTEGATFTCTASSAGGSSTLQTLFIKRDATAPTITYGGNAGTYAVTDTVSITCTPGDNLSGVATSMCAPVSGNAYTFAAGANTFNASATDVAGNVGAGSVTFMLNVTPSGLCELTGQFVRSSTAYDDSRPAHHAAADALTATACASVSKIASRITHAKNAIAVRIYNHHVDVLLRAGWLTAPQAETLTRLADAL